MRFEESDGELRIIEPGVERVSERDGLLLLGVLGGIIGTAVLVGAWADIMAQALTPNLSLGVVLFCLSAWTLWKALHLEDTVCRISFDYERKIVRRGRRFAARLNEVCYVRCASDESLRPTLTLVVQRGQRVYAVPLCRERGTVADNGVFEQAASRIAEILCVGVEKRGCLVNHRRDAGIKQRL